MALKGVVVKTATVEKIHLAIADQINNGASYIEALCEYAATNEIDIETVAAIVKKSDIIKEKLKREALSLNMLKRDPNDRNLFD